MHGLYLKNFILAPFGPKSPRTRLFSKKSSSVNFHVGWYPNFKQTIRKFLQAAEEQNSGQVDKQKNRQTDKKNQQKKTMYGGYLIAASL